MSDDKKAPRRSPFFDINPPREPFTTLPGPGYPPPYISEHEREKAEALKRLVALLEREKTTPEPEASTKPTADEPKEPFSEKALLALFRRLKGGPLVRNRDIAKKTAEAHFGVTIEVKQIRAALRDAGIKGRPGAPKGPRNKSGK